VPFLTLFVNAFCGDCGWGDREEDPTPADQARVIRRALAHRRDYGHNTAIERGQTYAKARGSDGDEGA
jgi:hypothetical protein